MSSQNGLTAFWITSRLLSVSYSDIMCALFRPRWLPFQVEAALEALSSIDDVSVVRSGDASDAYNFG